MRFAFWLSLALGVAACDGAEPTSATDPSEKQDSLGELSLNLRGVDSSGRVYRLRNATFSVDLSWSQYSADGGPGTGADGGFSTTVSSETNLDQAVISVRLIEGSYSVTLTNSDWYIERNTAGGWERVSQTALLSPRTQYSWVGDEGVSSLSFRFGVDGQLIDFRSGVLNIGVEIEQPGDLPDAGYPIDASPWQDAAPYDATIYWPDTGLIPDGSVTPSADSGVRRACGASAGNTCLANEYCAYQAGDYCGLTDATSVCRQMPASRSCTANRPVCACDQKTYQSACHAAAAGQGVYQTGACSAP
jgi:hypothetical protein